VLFISGFTAASFWILRPFLGALIWAIMIVVATWPLMLSVQKSLRDRRWLAVAVMTLVLLLLLIAPFSAAIGTIVANLDDIAGWINALKTFELPPPPSWLNGMPVVGERVTQLWQEVSTQGYDALVAKAAPYAGALTRWFAAEVGSFGALFIQLLLTVVMAAILYAHGELAAAWVLRFAARLAGPPGEAVARLSAQAIRGVALGVVVTALVQALIGGFGLVIAGVPFAPLLTALMFMLAVAQIGAVPVLAVAVAWLFWSDSVGDHCGRGYARQYPAPDPDPQGGEPAVAADLRWCHWWVDRLWFGWHIHRPHGAGRDLYLVECLDRYRSSRPGGAGWNFGAAQG
jgi:predicted PurR-regulated permease PerM